MISWGTCCGDSDAAAISLVTRSVATTTISVPQKRGGLGLALSIFFALLALDAVSRVRKRVESLEADVAAAVVALTELLGIPVQAAQRFVDMPEKPSFLAGEQERLLALHGVGALVGHVERVGTQIAIGALGRGSERLVVVAELLEHALPFFEQALLEMLKALLRHS